MHFLAGSVSMIEQTRTEVKKRFFVGPVSHGVVSPDSPFFESGGRFLSQGSFLTDSDPPTAHISKANNPKGTKLR